MEKRELLEELPDRRIYGTEVAMIHWVEMTGEHAQFHNTMHSFLMQGLASEEVSCDFVETLSETEFAAVKTLEIPMTLTVLSGGEHPTYRYRITTPERTGGVDRAQLIDRVLIEEALLNIEDTGRYVWDILQEYFAQHQITLGQIDLRFAHLAEHFIVLTGVLTPETMHLLDPETGKRLWDGPGGMEQAYERMMERMGG